jgi:hypothetical protein
MPKKKEEIEDPRYAGKSDLIGECRCGEKIRATSWHICAGYIISIVNDFQSMWTRYCSDACYLEHLKEKQEGGENEESGQDATEPV